MLEQFSYADSNVKNVYRNNIEKYEQLVMLVQDLSRDCDEEKNNDNWTTSNKNLPHIKEHSIQTFWATLQTNGSPFVHVKAVRWNEDKRRWESTRGKPLNNNTRVLAWKEFVIPDPFIPEKEKDGSDIERE